jgi:hypothetical protein
MKFIITTLHYVSFLLFTYFCFVHTRSASKVALPLLFHTILIIYFIFTTLAIGLVVFESNLTSLLLLSIFVYFKRLIESEVQLISSFQFIFYGLVNTRVTWSTFYVDCLQTTHISFIHSYTILKRVVLWTFEHVFFLNFGVIRFLLKCLRLLW